METCARETGVGGDEDDDEEDEDEDEEEDDEDDVHLEEEVEEEQAMSCDSVGLAVLGNAFSMVITCIALIISFADRARGAAVSNDKDDDVDPLSISLTSTSEFKVPSPAHF